MKKDKARRDQDFCDVHCTSHIGFTEHVKGCHIAVAYRIKQKRLGRKNAIMATHE